MRLLDAKEIKSLSLNKVKFEVEWDNLYCKNSQEYKCWQVDWMNTTSCEYSQLKSPQDWTRRREELWNVKSIQKIRILSWLHSSMDLEVQILMNWPKTLWACYTHLVLVFVQFFLRFIEKNISCELNYVSFSNAVFRL